jgi:D-alanyl-D-alanine carboxypeptidase/D-alanyl-D-alanine-endopeptidase (penicillin-binding protein 4)
MIKLTKLLLIGLTLFNLAYANNASSLNELLLSSNTHIGLMVMDADSGKTIYQYQANQYFPPASVTKLFTAIAALKSLGPDYQFITTLNAEPHSLQGQTLNGNLYIKFSGDPSLTSADLQQLFAHLTQNGVHKINGNIILVNTIFTPNLHALGVTYDDSMWEFGAVADSIMLDGNSFNVQLDDQANYPVITKIMPNNFKVQSKLIWLNESNQNICTFQVQSASNDQITLSGCLPHEISMLNLAIPYPEKYAMDVVKNEIKTAGIKFNGAVQTGQMPTNASIILASHHSNSLSILTIHMLKVSDNLYAVALSKTMGIHKYGIGSDKAGVAATMDYLQPYALPQYFLENGSGTSRYNLTSPTVMAMLLYNAKHDDAVSNSLMSALPIAGMDGTLQDFPSTLLKGKIFAKTGTMDHVANLSGYMINQNGKMLVFSLLMDDSALTDQQLHGLQAKILEQIYALEING